MATAKAPRTFSSFICHACRQRLLPARRAFSTSPITNAENDAFSPSRAGGLGATASSMTQTQTTTRPRTSATNPSSFSSIIESGPDSFLGPEYMENLADFHRTEQPHRLHVYATKHNTHITFVQPSKPASQTVSSGVSGTSASSADQKKQVDVLLSLSAGNIGFRKAGRGSYDAAYQLAAFVLKQIQDKGMARDVNKLEVVLRGFGAGREAVSKVLLGTEGRHIRGRITSVVDATRLKQGGPRSKKPRRLG
ncbi:hypothetical protein PRZ48_000020 [Zasmidium cellare]|uniref:Translational machinery component n=1 Tax=Zasmidium cellare TaxID=395010 RepID=A0ABR0EYK6_ZASCE|nr:hypothetical protein PRZ48_000020 [Zasmidium cellare]